MKGIVKFCRNGIVIEQRFYHSREHREMIVSGYKGAYADSIVFAPLLEGETWDDIITQPEAEVKQVPAHESMMLWDRLFNRPKKEIAIA